MIKYRGAGGKGGGRAAVEGENTLRSTQEAEVIELLSEGPIVGFVNPDGISLVGGNELQSIYLNNIPIQNSNGTFNFQNTELDFDYRLGTQVQAPLNGYADSGQRTTFKSDNNSEIKNVFPNGISQIVSNSDLQTRGIEIIIGVSQFFQQSKKKGDTVATTVEFEIWLKEGPNGSFYKVQDAEITGKTTTKFQKPYLIYVDGTAPQYTVQVRRTTPDRINEIDPDFAYQDAIYLEAYTIIRSQSLNYPNSAVCRLRIKSDQFSAIPSRAYLIRGKLIKVPSNYNPNLPHNRFVGVWDGTFKLEWTDNPAWIFYDLVTNKIYGLGDYLTEADTNKWALYEIGKYCDEPVPDGFGSLEKRFACNIWITTAEDAFRMLYNLASAFRGMHYWAAAQLQVHADAPRSAVHTFTQANVVGEFNYSGTSLKSRHTVAHVVWNDPEDFFKQKVEYVELQDMVAQWGVIPADVVGFGCTSRGQAHRLGKWLLFTENYETETVTFQASLDSAIVLPGDVFEVADAPRHQQRYGGRIGNISSNIITLDGPVPNGPCTLAVLVEDSGNVTRENAPKLLKITGSVTGGTTFTASSSVVGTAVNQIWTLESTTYKKELYRAISIEESEGLFTVSGLEYWPDKYNFVEQNLQLQPKQGNTTNPGTGNVGVSLDTPVLEGNWYVEYLYYSAPGQVSTGVTVSWAGNSPKYKFYYRKAGEPIPSRPGFVVTDRWEYVETETTSVDIKPIEPYEYEVRIVGVNSAGTESQECTGTMLILGKLAPPSDVVSITIEETLGGLKTTWPGIEDLDLKGYQVRRFKGVSPTWEAATTIAEIIIDTSLLDSEVLEADMYTYYVKAIDTSGNESVNPASTTWQVGGPSDNITNLTAYGITNAVELYWLNPTNADINIKHVEILINMNNDYDTAWLDGTTTGEYYKIQIPVPLDTWYFWVRVLDRNGNYLSTVGPVSAAALEQQYKNATIHLFQWGTAVPLKPTGTQVYTWETGNLTPYSGGNGWSASIGVNPGIPLIKLWVAAVDITAEEGVPTTTVDWSNALVSVYSTETGQEGDFIQTAPIKVFRQELTTPSGPTGTSTYTWSSGNFADPSGWSKTLGSPIPGMTIYSANILLQDSKAASTTTINWVQAMIQVEGYNGLDGAPGDPGSPGNPGAQGASYRIGFARFSNVSPVQGTVTTSGGSSFPTSGQSNSAWGMSTAWVANDPNPSSTNSLFQIDGIYNPVTAETIWTTPYISSLKVGTLSAITVNTGNLSVTGNLQANTFDFNQFTGVWSAGSGMKLYSSGWFGVGNQNHYTTIYSTGLRIKGNLTLGDGSNLRYLVSDGTQTVNSGVFSGIHMTKLNPVANTVLLTGVNTRDDSAVAWFHKGIPGTQNFNYRASGGHALSGSFSPRENVYNYALAYMGNLGSGFRYAAVYGGGYASYGDYAAGSAYAKAGLFERSYTYSDTAAQAYSRIELSTNDTGMRVGVTQVANSSIATFARYSGAIPFEPMTAPNPATRGTSYIVLGTSSYAIDTGGYIHDIRSGGTFAGGDFNVPGSTIQIGSSGIFLQNTSDVRLKDIVGYVTYGLEELKQITPIKYTWKDKELRGSDVSLGFSAQQLKNILPEVIQDNGEQLIMKDYQLLPVLVNAIKELEAQVAELRKRLDNA